MTYILKCYTSRKAGLRRIYIGESSCSGFQRGQEHLKEVKEDVATHPVVTHFQEEHEGREQEVMMRIIGKHQTPLEKQVMESVLIEELTQTED